MSQQPSNFAALVTVLFLTVTKCFSQGNPEVFSPMFSHLSGRYNTDILVGLTSSTAGTNIYYTLDGSTPTSSSQLYTGTIPISGNGNQVTVKALAINASSEESFISSATYVIDNNYDPNSDYLTNLTWSQYNNYIDGDWFGYASTPWTCDYSVKVKILGNGNYVDTTTSTGCFDPIEDYFFPVFYYGTKDTSSLKTIELYTILSSGYANGFITIDFGPSGTNQYELRYIKFMDEDNLFLEMWHGPNGPLQYHLTKNRITNLGLDDLSTEHATKVYPNPTTDFLIIENLQSDITLTNQLGQVFTLERSNKIDVSHLPKGMYYLQFTNNLGEQTGQKLVID